MLKLRTMFGEILRGARREKRIKQYELAERLGLTITHLSLLENDKTTPTMKTLKKWCDSLGYKIQLIEK